MKKAIVILTGILVVLIIGGVVIKSQQLSNPTGEVNIIPQQKVIHQPEITTMYSCIDGDIRAREYNTKNISTEYIASTSCLGPDGKAYDSGTQLTFYQTAFKAQDIVDPDCLSITKVCSQGKFVGEDPENKYSHLKCRVVDPNQEDTTLCEYKGSKYLPGEKIYKYKDSYPTLDQNCQQVLASCNDNGERYTEYPDFQENTCQFIRSFSTNYLMKVGDKEITPESISCIISTGNNCKTPRGTEVLHGDSVLSFLEQSISFEDICNIRQSTCYNGSWANDIYPYPNPSCQRALPKDCLVNGTTISHDSSLELYTDHGCESITRHCYDGVLDGNDKFKYTTCSEDDNSPPPTSNNIIIPQQVDNNTREPNCPAPFGGANRVPGQQGTAYMNNNVKYGSTCNARPIVCRFGSIRWGTNENPGENVGQIYDNCIVGEAIGCTHKCGDIEHGQKLITYDKQFIQHGAGETCEQNGVTSECKNGKLSPTPLEYCSCKISEPLGCVDPTDTPVAHGTELTLYKDKKVIAGKGDGQDVCERQRRQCLNGTRYDANGDKSQFSYIYPQCQIVTE